MSDTIVKVLPYSADLAKPLKKTYLDTLLVTKDNEAHRFEIALFKDKAQMTLPSGTAMNAYFIRYSDNATITLDGEISGNVLSVTLKKPCYSKCGQFAVIIKVTDGDVISTAFYGEGTMLVSVTDTILDEENVVPSISDLLAQIAVMEAGTKAANEAANAANEAAGHAPYVNTSNNHWMTWDTESREYVDTGVMATGPEGPQGPASAGTVNAVTVSGTKYEADQTGNIDLGELGSGDVQTVCGVAPDENGNVTLNAESVGARKDTWMPTASEVRALPDSYEAPVKSVNGMTGAVSINVGVTSVNGITGAVTVPVLKLGVLQYDAEWDSGQNAFCIPVSAFTNPVSTTDASKLAFFVQVYGRSLSASSSFVAGSNLYIRCYTPDGEPWGAGERINIIYLTA